MHHRQWWIDNGTYWMSSFLFCCNFCLTAIHIKKTCQSIQSVWCWYLKLNNIYLQKENKKIRLIFDNDDRDIRVTDSFEPLNNNKKTLQNYHHNCYPIYFWINQIEISRGHFRTQRNEFNLRNPNAIRFL